MAMTQCDWFLRNREIWTQRYPHLGDDSTRQGTLEMPADHWRWERPGADPALAVLEGTSPATPGSQMSGLRA